MMLLAELLNSRRSRAQQSALAQRTPLGTTQSNS